MLNKERESLNYGKGGTLWEKRNREREIERRREGEGEGEGERDRDREMNIKNPTVLLFILHHCPFSGGIWWVVLVVRDNWKH